MFKKPLTLEEIDDQAAAILPDRRLLQCTAVVGCINAQNILTNILNNSVNNNHVCVAAGVISAGSQTARC